MRSWKNKVKRKKKLYYGKKGRKQLRGIYRKKYDTRRYKDEYY